MFPIGTDRPQRRIAWVNILLIAANIVIYLMSHGTTAGHGDPSELLPAWQPYMLGGVHGAHPALIQFITYQFLHQNFYHILGNMIFLYVFGNNLNEKLGHVGYLLFYITGGILAGCGQMLAAPGVPTLGASGSISAVTGLFFVLLPRTNIRVFLWIFFYVDIIEIPSMWFILFSVAKDILEPWLFPGSPVANSAHLAGSFSGFAIGVLLLATRLVPRDHYDLLAMLERHRRRKEYESLVSKGYDPFSPTRGVAASTGRSSSPPPPPIDPRIADLREEILRLIDDRRIAPASEQYLLLRRLAPQAVLPAAAQLDIANQLMSDARYDDAAQAYENYLQAYPKGNGSTPLEQVQLILGLIYARYLPRPTRAIELLRTALANLHDPGQHELAQAELTRLQALS